MPYRSPTPAPSPATTPASSPDPLMDLREDAPIKLDFKTGLALIAMALSVGGTWVLVKTGVATAETGVVELRQGFATHIDRDTTRLLSVDQRLAAHDLKLQAVELQSGTLERRFDRLEAQMAQDKKDVLEAINKAQTRRGP